MTSPSDPAARLRDAATCVAAGLPVPEDLRADVVEVLSREARGRESHRAWADERSAPYRERDTLVVVLGQTYGTATCSAKARWIHAALKQYAETTWALTRVEERCPHAIGSRLAAIWAVLRSTGGTFPTERRIMRILARGETVGREIPLL